MRHLLGEGAAADAVPHLLITRDTLGLHLTSAIKLALHLLYEAWTVARASTRTVLTMPEGERRSLLVQLQRAPSLRRGEFLEGFSLRDAPAFGDWVRFQRAYWHLRTSEIFDRSPRCNLKRESWHLPLQRSAAVSSSPRCTRPLTSG